ncbi:MAG TPA: molecular chaperone HtpG [Bacteroidales bacterium]|nr:molecular chaperone HtpG [Bacteroidales bacterium]
MQNGKINVQTENIFPIIKKFLYSDHEIFLREIISNAVDATQKLKTLVSLGKYKEDLGDITIKVTLDKKAGTLTVSDRGIGMTQDEVEKYINQIAFSSAEDFVKKFKTKSESEMNAIIGHFGLGFYSSFMVSDKVEINTKTYKKGGATKPVHWECDGSPDYTLSEGQRDERGTEIVMHISNEASEFLEEYRILSLLKKYCKFLPVPIEFGTEKKTRTLPDEQDEKGEPKTETYDAPRIINNPNPAWKIKPADLKEEDYNAFYRELYPMVFEEPLFNIHLNVDYPFNLTGILYFPKVKNKIEVQKEKIQLYCNQVFVTDEVSGIVPDFLTLLHGVIDSPDIPLNVSRSYLQSDSNVKKISNHIMKKVSDKLEEIFTNDRKNFEAKWDDIRIFIQYGMISEPKFNERAKKFALLKNTAGEYFTLEDYKAHIETLQKDKNNTLVYLYTTDVDGQHTYINAAKERGYDVLVFDGPIDNHFINHMEQEMENTTYKRVDAEVIDKLIEKEESVLSKLTEEQINQLKPLFEKDLEKSQFEVKAEHLSEQDLPVIITQNEYMRRMKDMAKIGGGMEYMNNMPDNYTLVVNTNHPLMGRILEMQEESEKENLVKQIRDLAFLSHNLLKGEALNNFVKRSVELL